MIGADLLRRIRNDLPMSVTIAALGRERPPSKVREGRFCFFVSLLWRDARGCESTQQSRPLLRVREEHEQH